MAKLVVVKTGGVLGGLIAYVFFMILVVAGLYPLLTGVAGVAGIVLAFMVITLVSYFLIKKTLFYIYINRIVDRFRKLIVVEDDVIRFKKPIEVEKGVLKYLGIWLGYYRHYHTEYFFQDMGVRETIDKIDASKETIDYTLLLNEDRAGYIEAPGYFVTEPGLEGSIVVILRKPRPGETSFTTEKKRLHVVSERDLGEAVIETEDTGVKGSIYLFTRKPGSRLSIYLSSIVRVGRGELSVSKKLAETRRDKKDFKATIYPSETIVLVGHIKTLSPYNIARVLKQTPVIWGACRGEHWIRLELESSITRIEKDYTRIKVSITGSGESM